MHLGRWTRLAAAAALLTLSTAAMLGQASPATKDLKTMDPALMNTSVDPCTDFYQYACGGWLKQNPVPSDQASYGRDTELMEENRLVLKSILDRAAAGGSGRSPNEQKIGDYYAACMNLDAINAAGLKPLAPLLERIEALTGKDGLAELAAAMTLENASPFFDFGSTQDFKNATEQIASFDQASLGLPEKGYYERIDEASVRLREAYRAHVAKMFALLGEAEAKAQADAATVLALETRLAKASLSNVERRDPTKLYHKETVAALDHMTPGFAFDRYLKGVQAPRVTALNVTSPAYFAALHQAIEGTSLNDLKTYLRWVAVRHLPSTVLPSAFDEENFAFYGKTLSGQPERQARWKRCVDAVDGSLGEALGQVYVAERFPPEDKVRTQALTKDVEAAMGREIDQLTWMSPATKVRAREKLNAVANKIGYPDKWRDYSSLTVEPEDALGNAERAAVFAQRREIQKIGKPVDRGEWEMSPPTVNAYYNPRLNDINFPAGILQPPYFDPRQHDAVNYGDAGGVIGHELTHGFDDEGRQFDAHGNLADWWTKEDTGEFNQRADCVVKEYDGFVAVDDLHVNGRLTLGENIADLGGLKLAFVAYLDRARQAGTALEAKGGAAYGGLKPVQQFFVAYAQGWCANTRPKEVRLRTQVDPHSPENFRVNGVVVNLPEFQKAFSCRTGQPMAPASRCAIW